jgi:uncharacterized protein
MEYDTQKVFFKNGSQQIAALLNVPTQYGPEKPGPAIVIATPGSSVKEQIGSHYARPLAEEGFITLAFDPSFQGQSEGEPRDQENPVVRIEDIRCAIDFLNTLDRVNDQQIGLLGVCAGGGYAMRAAVIDKRIKALGTVVASDIGSAMRGFAGSSEKVLETLREAADQRALEARGGDYRRDPWIPDSEEEAAAQGITDPDLLNAVNFYRTPRGFNEYSTNRLLFRSMADILSFDGFNLVEDLLDQPVKVIVGGVKGTTGSYDVGVKLQALAKNAEALVVIEGAGHYDMYDNVDYIKEAVGHLSGFFQRNLAMVLRH